MPAFNPGHWIEPAIASILGQTLTRSAYEAILVDDGSTDATPARLDALAEAEPDLIRVVHLTPSGAPGRPRNAGLAAARGEYVQFLDADDELAPDGLERALALAQANRSDVVVEKFASASIARPQRLFGATIPSTTLERLPELLDSSLGPSKLFRRAFLVEQGIEFPEGWRLMEDQAFAIRAYARAAVISVLADAVCYRYLARDDGGQLTSARFDLDNDLAHLERLWDLATAELSSGPALTRFRRRMYRSELLGRLGDEGFLSLPPDEQERFVAVARSFAADRVDDGLIAGLGMMTRRRADLVRDGRVEDLVELARATTDIGLRTAIDRIGWDDGRLEVRAHAWLARRTDGHPLVVTGRDGRRWLDLSRPQGDRPIAPFDVTEAQASQRVDVFFQEPRTMAEWGERALAFPDFRPADAADGQVPAVRIAAAIDPASPGASDRPLDLGVWGIRVRLEKFGLVHDGPLVAADPASVAERRKLPGTALVGRPATAVRPALDGDLGLTIVVGPATAAVAAALEEGRLTAQGGRAAVLIDLVAASDVGPLDADLIVRRPAGDRRLPSRLVPAGGLLRLEPGPLGAEPLPEGTYPLLVHLGGRDGAIPLGTVAVDERGRLSIGGIPGTDLGGRASRAVARLVERAGPPTRRWADLVARILRRASATVRRWEARLASLVGRGGSAGPGGPQ